MTNTNKHGVDHEELKRCPHCGGKAGLVVNTDALAGNGAITIMCCTDMEEGFILPEYIKSGSKDSMEKARSRVIKAWNTRTDTQELEQLRWDNKRLLNDNKRMAVRKLELCQERDELAALLKVAACPSNCTDGAYPDNYGEPVQCLFCYERKELLKC